jgi:hypothetical protein
MKIVIEKIDFVIAREFNERVISTLRGLPGTASAIAALRSQSDIMDEDVNVEEIQAVLNPEMITISREENGDIVIAVSEAAMRGTMDLYAEYVDVVVELAIAAFPIFRLAKRLFTGLGDKMEKFAASLIVVPKEEKKEEGKSE